jgi:phospholipase/carboxylesterase
MELTYRERPAAESGEGLLVLHHGRGTDERDLLGLADVLDPGRRWHVASPRAPLQLPGSPGYHWYLVPRVGYPDHDTFHAARRDLAEFHDRLWEQTGIEPARTVLGGFSMGTVMSYTMALSEDRPPVAGTLAFSGFIPVVEDWQPHLEDRRGTRVFIAHGRADPVIGVEFARSARRLLEDGGLAVEYRESDVGHQIDPRDLDAAAGWLDRVWSVPKIESD